jgi:protease I
MATVLIPIPRTDFDPTETGVPWSVLQSLGHTLAFSTPDGTVAQADPRMLTGERLGILAPLLIADANGRKAYRAMQESKAFQRPIPYREIHADNFDALLLPGGHAPGMKPYLESEILQATVVDCFAGGKPVAAICHGVLLAARSRAASGKSVLFGRRTTALTKRMEISAWFLTRAWLGNYYRTYPKPVETEVGEALAGPEDFIQGPASIRRDSPANLQAGFTVLDGNYLSARWPGDAHRFATEFAALLQAPAFAHAGR